MDLADLNRQEDEIAQSIADLRDLLNSKDVSLFFAKKSRNAKFKKKNASCTQLHYQSSSLI